jgi:GT2 family glycosyltransferase
VSSQPAEFIGVGVPAYRGVAYIAEALRSLQRQTHRDLAVLISVDGTDEETAAACAPFLRDSRFKLVIQPARLGWAANTSFVMAQNECPFWHYLAQDDLVEPDYVATLLAHARANPQAAVTFCDIQCFDENTDRIGQSPVLGPAAAREISLMLGQHAAVALRGLTRQYALQQTHGLRENEVANFSADTVWMASAARAGELHRVPAALYRKRYHRDNVHTKWAAWPPAQRVKGWQAHCRDMLFEAAQAEATVPERRLIWGAALARLTSTSTEFGYIPAATFDTPARLAMLEGFLTRFTPRDMADASAKLELPFDRIAEMSRALLGIPRRSLLERLGALFR